jgi:hypothetical protein
MNKFLLPKIIKDFTNHNLKHVRRIDYTINNQLKCNWPRHTYESIIILENNDNDIDIRKTFSNNCYYKLEEEMKNFLEKEIRV